MRKGRVGHVAASTPWRADRHPPDLAHCCSPYRAPHCSVLSRSGARRISVHVVVCPQVPSRSGHEGGQARKARGGRARLDRRAHRLLCRNPPVARVRHGRGREDARGDLPWEARRLGGHGGFCPPVPRQRVHVPPRRARRGHRHRAPGREQAWSGRLARPAARGGGRKATAAPASGDVLADLEVVGGRRCNTGRHWNRRDCRHSEFSEQS
mmetsp:Transcript_19262/g.54214  ORF Transcript_19262/g.54214 Transcript_19262/m.54214 type:complete len:210 (-) Transcript_19262:48-677(-)